MARVTVYRFWVYDVDKDTSHLSPSYRTKVEIRRMGFEPDWETALDVDEALLDEQGRYYLRKGGDQSKA